MRKQKRDSFTCISSMNERDLNVIQFVTHNKAATPGKLHHDVLALPSQLFNAYKKFFFLTSSM